MHDIIIEIREIANVHVHLENKYTIVEMETIGSLYTEKVKRGSGGLAPPRSQRNEKKSNKMEASPFR